MWFIQLNWLKLLAFSALIIVLCESKVHKGTSKCEKMDCTQGKNCVSSIEVCTNLTAESQGQKISLDEPHNHMLCFASWMTPNGSYEPVMVKKGCWMNDEVCIGQTECLEERFSSPIFFCCCDGDLCNREFHHRPKENKERKKSVLVEPGYTKQVPEQQLIKTILYSIVPILGVFLLVVTIFFMWRRHQRHVGHTQLPTVDPSLAPTPSQSSLNLQLLELKAKGRYGSVWKAQLPDQYVAVKIFPLQDKQSWMSEIDIYNLPHMKQENILHFIGSERREDTLNTELWLVTEFHEKGTAQIVLMCSGNFQVGTRRYMAPEVLEGAICFNRDSFLRIDMYACGLVIWELMTRCTGDGPVKEYHLPFEAEVGLQPTLEEMQTLVVTQKVRPAINPSWEKHPGLSKLISTVEECWDQDAEARLSAGCVLERLGQLSRNVNSGSEGQLIDQLLSSTPLVSHQPQHMYTSSYVPNTAVIDMGRDSMLTSDSYLNSC
uniref:Serine/threonine-protein kinase receptor n=1 Tax=Biomphalaria glabrata TaxID=6526 RepID=A0A2C9JWC5_BIOGL